ncbi:TrkH family potassium uptake protein [uncultured Anaerofustis sp.]|uniref:TrkH family potassium uptake protein n=1 Tax=uncultured Anaerofustis sp. TaxID=904996 RepID=UPI0025FB541D|nr:TrkH family potassium uptake protein [uncultured Anaerofustis sp.]
MTSKLKLKLSYTQIIALGFFLTILVGGILLMLPISSRSGEFTPFLNSIFTATSATCVTGLIVFDTYTHWSIFGQIVIICLIQIGGIGFMTIITMFSIFLKRQIGLHERRLLMQSAGSMQLSGVVKLILRIVKGTILFEGLGAILLSIRFIPEMGFKVGIYNAVFHAISAFCNAGFDLMGRFKEFSSLTRYSDDIIVNITIMSLIVIGGIGFLVWSDIIKNKWHIRRYELHSKIVISASAILILGGAVLFFLFETKNGVLVHSSMKESILASLFQSVTPRTAGFNTVDWSSITQGTSIFTIVLMLIGGSPGSTAGGMKTTTLVVLVMSAVASSRHKNNITIFKRRLDADTVKQASAVFTLYFVGFLAGSLLLCYFENLPAISIMFEVSSAIGTVGSSMGITTTLCAASKCVIIALMYAGRVGALTLMLTLAAKKKCAPVERPAEKILIG